MIVNISESDLEAAAKVGLPREKLTVIRNGICTEPPRNAVPILFDQSKINVLFVGRHDPQKGLDLLISAMRLLAGVPVHLHVLGSPIVSTGTGLDKLSPNVTFYGWVQRDQVSAYIGAADAVIVPSRWEGFGLVAIEAMRMARPVIASKCGGLAEIVIDGETGVLFPPDNSQAIVETLKSLDPARLRSMRPLALERFKQNFTASRMNTQLLDLYESLTRTQVANGL